MKVLTEYPTPATDVHELATSVDHSMSDEVNIQEAYKFARSLEQKLAMAREALEKLLNNADLLGGELTKVARKAYIISAHV